ncbi:sensor histidine kinase [Haloplanus litoreus]|uniref:sensor histidine kinase n=1 Tax=Haloplanus litoreus TaxID=767515 RepID=UPI0036205E72
MTDEDADSIDLERLVRDCWQLVETHGADLRIEGTCTVRADEGRLRRLLENLFRNSVEHGSTALHSGPRGEGVDRGSPADRVGSDVDPEPTADPVTITVGVLDDFVRGARAESAASVPRSGFYVADDGVGIPAERRDRVFDDGYSTQPSGTGFGLSIVREITDAHDWTVEVTESADGGARFEFRGIEGLCQGSNATRT